MGGSLESRPLNPGYVPGPILYGLETSYSQASVDQSRKKQKKFKICSDCMQAPILAHGLITTSKNLSNFSACNHFRKMSGIQVLISAVTCCMGVATLGNGHHAQAMHALWELGHGQLEV